MKMVSKQQCSTTISQKKVKPKPQTMKNVLLTPYKRSWPILAPEHYKEFEDLFSSNLSLLVPQEQPKVPWSVLKEVPKEQRKDFRRKHRQPIEIDDNLRRSLIFGVNECTKALEQHKIVAVLISSSCNPEMMVNHIIRIAEKRKIAVLIINSLKETLKKLVGFECVCLGFRKFDELNVLGKLKQIVDFIYKVKNMTIADILEITHDAKLKIDMLENNNNLGNKGIDLKNNEEDSNMSTITISDSTEMDNTLDITSNSPTNIVELSQNSGTFLSETFPNKNCVSSTFQNLNKIETSDIIILSDSPEPDLNFSDSVQIIEDNSVEIVETTSKHIPVISNPNLTKAEVKSNLHIEAGPYLYRTSTKRRVFEPPKLQAPQKNAETCSNNKDFISFSNNLEEYVPSIVKRMKGSKKIKKKKIKTNKNK